MYIVNVTFADGYTSTYLINTRCVLNDFTIFHFNSEVFRIRKEHLPIFLNISNCFDDASLWWRLKNAKIKDVFHVQYGEPVRIDLRTKDGKNKRMRTPFLTIGTILEHYENSFFAKCDNDIEYLNPL